MPESLHELAAELLFKATLHFGFDLLWLRECVMVLFLSACPRTWEVCSLGTLQLPVTVNTERMKHWSICLCHTPHIWVYYRTYAPPPLWYTAHTHTHVCEQKHTLVITSLFKVVWWPSLVSQETVDRRSPVMDFPSAVWSVGCTVYYGCVWCGETEESIHRERNHVSECVQRPCKCEQHVFCFCVFMYISVLT